MSYDNLDWSVTKHSDSHFSITYSPKTLLPSDYSQKDISSEEWREVECNGITYRIDNPTTLITRKGGSTHRVIDANGVVHCYAAPETGKTILRWKAKEGTAPVKF